MQTNTGRNMSTVSRAENLKVEFSARVKSSMLQRAARIAHGAHDLDPIDSEEHAESHKVIGFFSGCWSWAHRLRQTYNQPSWKTKEDPMSVSLPLSCPLVGICSSVNAHMRPWNLYSDLKRFRELLCSSRVEKVQKAPFVQSCPAMKFSS